MPEEAKLGAETPEGQKQARKSRVATAHRRGVVGRTADAIVAPLSELRLPTLDWKMVSYGLLVLIAIILVARNWAPVRLNIFGWYLDMPKAIAFGLFFALGVLCTVAWERRRKKAKHGSVAPESVEEAEELADEDAGDDTGDDVDSVAFEEPVDLDEDDEQGGELI